MRGGIVPGSVEVTRDTAWATLTRYTKSESLLRHALAVEASTRFYARKLGEDEELWGCVALLHDFDYEMHPTLDKHPQDGAPILREEGYPEVLIDAVLSHAEHLELPRDTPLKRTLFACDELSGFVHACGLVRPTGLDGLEPKSVKKKLKQPSFAAGVHRDEVYAGAELLGLELDEHIANVDRGAAADRRRARAPQRRRRRLTETPYERPTRGHEPLEVVVARPPAARDAHQPAAGQLADVDVRRVEPGDDVGGRLLGSERDERRGDRRRDELDPRREERAAAGRGLRGAVVRPVGAKRERGEHAPERRPTTTSRTRTGGRPDARRSVPSGSCRVCAK